jgi:hypothetical protein
LGYNVPLLSALTLTCAVAALAATGFFGALALRLDSSAETLLAAYVLAWAWLVAALAALSPFHAVSVTSLWIALIVGLVGAGAAWQLVGRPTPSSSLRASLARAAASLRDGPLALLGAAVVAGLVYTLAVGVGVAANDGDALAYHLPRALFWKQQQWVGWVADVLDPRIDVMPPVAEMGQLATMLVSGSDRYVAAGPFFAVLASMVGIVQLARRLGADDRQAVFGALLFATLPVVVLQAASALNDLVVCSFLVCAAALLLSSSNAALAGGSLATGLAVATKVTAAFGLPWIGLLVLATVRRGRLLRLAALAGGAALGSWWYWLNVWHTGELDGGYAADSGQRPAGLGVVATTVRQLSLDLLDLSGVRGRDIAVFWLAALGLALAGLVAYARGRFVRGLLGGAVLVALVPTLLAPAGRVLLRGWQEAWSAVGDAELAYQAPTKFTLPVLADATESWYGPVLVVCLIVAPFALAREHPRRPRLGVLLACAIAPLASIVLLAAAVTYDPYRGRFLMFAVALAAVSWGSLLRWRSVAWGVAGLAAVSASMSLAMSLGKPSGLVLFEHDPGLASRASIWEKDRVDQQGQLRPGDDEIDLLRFVDRNVPERTSMALAPRVNDFLSPLFGRELGRRIILVSSDGRAPDRAAWLVSAPRAHVDPCPSDWRQVFGVGDWKVLHRVARGGCADG